LNILLLLTDGYGSLGGISQFNRDFMAALNASMAVNRVQALPRLIPNEIKGAIPEAIVYDRSASGSKTRFTWHAIEHAWTPVAPDLLICGHINLLPVAYFVARLCGARLALIMHGIDVWRPTSDPLTNRLARSVDAYLSVSSLTADRFVRWSQASPDRMSILPNCINLDRFTLRPPDPTLIARYNLHGFRVIATLGRLAPKERYKGFDEVLEVMPKLVDRFPKVKYLIIGDGEDRSRLTAKAASLGIAQNVVFTGRIPEEEKVSHYSLMDAYVMPSSGEGFGIVLLEAAACGIAVIGSNADGSREALMEGQLGMLVDPHKPDELTAAILRTLERSTPRMRPSGIETFGIDQFQLRVDRWLWRQEAAIRAKREAA